MEVGEGRGEAFNSGCSPFPSRGNAEQSADPGRGPGAGFLSCHDILTSPSSGLIPRVTHPQEALGSERCLGGQGSQ